MGGADDWLLHRLGNIAPHRPAAPLHEGKPVRALVFTTNQRTADNWLELFQKINANGGDCRLVTLRWTGDPSHEKVSSIGLPVLIDGTISQLSKDGISLAELEQVVARMMDWQPEVIFLADVQSYPSNAIHKLVSKYERKPMVIGLQHGFFQIWHFYNDNFCADYMFLFGERHVRAISAHNREKCFAVGLPKLDRLKDMPNRSKGYLFYIPQRFPDKTRTTALLEELSRATGIPSITNNHPQFGGLKDAPVSSDPFIDIAAGAEWVMTSYSTGGIEALYLRKEVVLLPSHGTTAWYGYPAIARELTVPEVMAARGAIHRYGSAIDEFIDDCMGGIRFDHTRRAWDALQALMTSGELSKAA